MTGAIINCISAAISLLAFSAIYIFTTTKVMPHFLLSPNYKRHVPSDKMLKKYKFPSGKGIVCEPDERFKEYLESYVIFTYENRKYLKCKFASEVLSARYEIAIYNKKHRLIKVLEIGENTQANGRTKAMSLPDATAYVSLILKKVNESETFSTLRRTSILKIGIFAILTVAMTVAYGLLVRTSVLNFSTLLNLQLKIHLGANLALSSIIGALLTALSLAICKKQVFGENND